MTLREYRKQSKLTIAKLAGLVGCSSQSIYLWENGKSLPSANNITRLADVFGVDRLDIMKALVEIYGVGNLDILKVCRRIKPDADRSHGDDPSSGSDSVWVNS